MGVDEKVYKVDVYNDTNQLIEVYQDDIDPVDVQTTFHIIEIVRNRIDPIETDVDGLSVDIVNANGGTIDSEAIAAIVRFVYVANEKPTGVRNELNRTFYTKDAYKPLSTRLFVNGLRQSVPDNYEEIQGNQILLSFTPSDSDFLLIDYIKL